MTQAETEPVSATTALYQAAILKLRKAMDNVCFLPGIKSTQTLADWNTI